MTKQNLSKGVLSVLRTMSFIDGAAFMYLHDHIQDESAEANFSYTRSPGLMINHDSWLLNYQVGYDIKRDVYVMEFNGCVEVDGKRKRVKEIVCENNRNDAIKTAKYLCSKAYLHKEQMKKDGRLVL